MVATRQELTDEEVRALSDDELLALIRAQTREKQRALLGLIDDRRLRRRMRSYYKSGLPKRIYNRILLWVREWPYARSTRGLWWWLEINDETGETYKTLIMQHVGSELMVLLPWPEHLSVAPRDYLWLAVAGRTIMNMDRDVFMESITQPRKDPMVNRLKVDWLKAGF